MLDTIWFEYHPIFPQDKQGVTYWCLFSSNVESEIYSGLWLKFVLCITAFSKPRYCWRKWWSGALVALLPNMRGLLIRAQSGHTELILRIMTHKREREREWCIHPSFKVSYPAWEGCWFVPNLAIQNWFWG